MRPDACAAAREALPVEPTAPAPDAPVREGAMEGVLVAVGKLGYRGASVRAILDYTGGHRKQFYEHFASKEDCFEQAYAAWIERLGVSLLEAAAGGGGWRAGLRAALLRLFELVAERPVISRALFVESQVAGGAVTEKHEEAVERIVAALDGVRSEIPAGSQPPDTTGIFVVGGIEACVCEVLAAGDPSRIRNALPELMHMAVGSYLGKQAGNEEFEAAKDLLERDRIGTGGEVG